MRYTGILRTWHDDKGFGFIAPTHGGAELFVHISEFAKGTGRPVQGEVLLYELGSGKDGRPQAVRVVRKAVGVVGTRNARGPKPKPPGVNLFGWMVSIAMVFGIGIYGFKQHANQSHRLAVENRRSEPVFAAPTNSTISPSEYTSEYTCDGRRTCSQMTSCKEATWFLKNCPGTEMDGNHDGVPCERQHCK